MDTIIIMIVVGIIATIIIQIVMFRNKNTVNKNSTHNKDFVNTLKVNDYVVTLGGIYGYVRGIENKKVLIEIAENTIVTIDINAIMMVLKQEE